MAYMTQEKKAKIAPQVKSILKKHGLKGSLSVENHSTLVLKISEGSIDFYENLMETARATGQETQYITKEIDVNPYWYHKHFSGYPKEVVGELLAAMNDGNHDRSNAQIDYFDVGWYVNFHIGTYKKPYLLEL